MPQERKEALEASNEASRVEHTDPGSVTLEISTARGGPKNDASSRGRTSKRSHHRIDPLLRRGVREPLQIIPMLLLALRPCWQERLLFVNSAKFIEEPRSARFVVKRDHISRCFGTDSHTQRPVIDQPLHPQCRVFDVRIGPYSVFFEESLFVH